MPIDVTEEFKREVFGAAEAPGSVGAEPKGSAVAEEFRRETLGVTHPGRRMGEPGERLSIDSNPAPGA
jgi:hypothetical protein